MKNLGYLDCDQNIAVHQLCAKVIPKASPQKQERYHIYSRRSEAYLYCHIAISMYRHEIYRSSDRHMGNLIHFCLYLNWTLQIEEAFPSCMHQAFRIPRHYGICIDDTQSFLFSTFVSGRFKSQDFVCIRSRIRPSTRLVPPSLTLLHVREVRTIHLPNQAGCKSRPFCNPTQQKTQHTMLYTSCRCEDV